MFLKVLRFLQLPLLMILIFAIGRFWVGAAGVPYAPRGNAMFSIVGVTLVSCIYYGAMSKKVGGFNWLGTLLIGVVLMEWAQILIFSATVVSVQGNFTTSYFTHWDALNIKEGEVLAFGEIMKRRTGAFLFALIPATIAVSLGRLVFGLLVPAPTPAQNEK